MHACMHDCMHAGIRAWRRLDAFCVLLLASMQVCGWMVIVGEGRGGGDLGQQAPSSRWGSVIASAYDSGYRVVEQ